MKMKRKITIPELSGNEQDLIFEAAQIYIRYCDGNDADQAGAAKLAKALMHDDYKDKDLNEIANKVLLALAEREISLDKARLCFKVGQLLISDASELESR